LKLLVVVVVLSDGVVMSSVEVGASVVVSEGGSFSVKNQNSHKLN